MSMAAGMTRPAVHSQLSSALDAVVHLGRDRDGRRRVRQVAVLTRRDDGLVEPVPAVSFDHAGGTHEHAGAATLGRLLERG